MLNYRVKKISDEYTVLEFESKNEKLEQIKVKNFNINDINQIADFYNLCGVIEDGIAVAYDLPSFGTPDPIIKPYKQEKCLNDLQDLFSYYCQKKDAQNAERIFNTVCIVAHNCNKIINNQMKQKYVFSFKDYMQIDREYNKVIGKANKKIDAMEK